MEVIAIPPKKHAVVRGMRRYDEVQSGYYWRSAVIGVLAAKIPDTCQHISINEPYDFTYRGRLY